MAAQIKKTEMKCVIYALQLQMTRNRHTIGLEYKIVLATLLVNSQPLNSGNMLVSPTKIASLGLWAVIPPECALCELLQSVLVPLNSLKINRSRSGSRVYQSKIQNTTSPRTNAR